MKHSRIWLAVLLAVQIAAALLIFNESRTSDNEAVDEPLQTVETPVFEDSNPGELIEDQVPATNAEPSDQLREENALSTPVVGAPPQEGATEPILR